MRSLVRLKGVFFTLLILTLAVMALPTQAQTAYVDFVFTGVPTSDLAIGDTTSVTVEVQTGTGQIDLAEVHLSFDPTVLQVVSLTPDTSNLNVGLVPAAFDNTAGTIDYAAGKFSAFPSGTFDLLTIEFEAVGAGTSAIAFIDPPGAPSTIATFGGANILNNAVDTSITVAGPTPTPDITITSPADGDTITGDSITVEWATTDALGDDHVHVTLNTDPYLGLRPLTGSETFSNLTPGTYTLTVEVANVNHVLYTNPEAIDSITVTLEAPTGNVDANVCVGSIFAVNAGGPQFTSVDGVVFEADNYFTAGKSYTNGAIAGTDIALTDNDALYRTERYGGKDANNPPFSYNFALTQNGTYEVQLLFAEIFLGVAGGNPIPGQRVFDVIIEGDIVLDDFDLLDTATGGPGAEATASVKSFQALVTDNSLDIDVTASVDNAKFSALCVIPIALDDEAPVITLNGDATVNLTVGDAYNEAGATVTDNIDQNLTATIGGDTVDTNTEDTYTVTYNATDNSGNVASEVTRTVIVNADTTPGTADIVLAPANPTVTEGDSFSIDVIVQSDTQPFNVAEAHFDFDNAFLSVDSITAGVALPSITLNTFNNGAGTIDYTAGILGNTVSGDVILMTINFTALQATTGTDIDFAPLVFPRESQVVFGGFNILGSLSGGTIVIEEPTNVPPVADAGSNQIVPDSDDSGDEAVTLDASGSADDGNIVSYQWSATGVTIPDGVSPTADFPVGTTTVTLTVTDDDNATDTDTVEITVNAFVDDEAPVITLLGDNPLQLTEGDTYTDPGATATDTKDGDISGLIVVGGDTVNPNTVGTYTVTYNVSDAAGNAADEVTREVTVNADIANSADIVLSPATNSVSVGQQFDVVALIESGTQEIDAGEIHLDFDPTVLQVVSLTSSSDLASLLQNEFDNNAGTIDYASGTFAPFPSGTTTLVTITFEAIAATTNTDITFADFIFPRQTQVTFDGQDILNTVSGASVEVIAGYTLTGTVTFQGRPTAPNAQWIEDLTVELYQGTTLVETFNVTTDDTGTFTISDIAPGVYDVWIKNPRTLANFITGVDMSADAAVNFGTLLAGDANDDNLVSLPDFSLLSGTFNAVSPNVAADFNNDGAVTLPDFSLLSTNFNTAGAAKPE